MPLTYTMGTSVGKSPLNNIGSVVVCYRDLEELKLERGLQVASYGSEATGGITPFARGSETSPVSFGASLVNTALGKS